MGRHIHVIGIGVGDPEYLTVQAIEALNGTQVFFAMDKGEAKSDLVALRREICARFIREPGYRFVELPDPERAAASDSGADYRDTVAEWHAARAGLWASAIRDELGPDAEVETHIEPLVVANLAGTDVDGPRRDAVAEALRLHAETIGVVTDVHSVRVRETSHGLVVNYHCRVDPGLDVATVHERVDALEQRVRKDIPQITRIVSHTEPMRHAEPQPERAS